MIKQIPVYQVRNGKAERLSDTNATDDLIKAVFMVQVPPDIPVKDMMHFWVPAQPLEVPPELLAMPPDELVVLRIGESTQHICHAYGCANTIKEIINRQSKGLFTLVEVADILADMRETEPKRIRIALESAYLKSELTIRDPDDLLAIVPPSYAAPYFVTTPDDVDRWLENIVHAPYRFPRIESPSQATTPPASPVVAEPEPVPAIKKEGYVLKRAAAIAKYSATWETIDADFRHASENGLTEAAKATKHGDWYETALLAWADQRGKRTEPRQSREIVNSVFAMAGTKHTF